MHPSFTWLRRKENPLFWSGTRLVSASLKHFSRLLVLDIKPYLSTAFDFLFHPVAGNNLPPTPPISYLTRHLLRIRHLRAPTWKTNDEMSPNLYLLKRQQDPDGDSDPNIDDSVSKQTWHDRNEDIR